MCISNNEFERFNDQLENEYQQARACENWTRMKEIERVWLLMDEEEMYDWNMNQFEEWVNSVEND